MTAKCPICLHDVSREDEACSICGETLSNVVFPEPEPEHEAQAVDTSEKADAPLGSLDNPFIMPPPQAVPEPLPPVPDTKPEIPFEEKPETEPADVTLNRDFEYMSMGPDKTPPPPPPPPVSRSSQTEVRAAKWRTPAELHEIGVFEPDDHQGVIAKCEHLRKQKYKMIGLLGNTLSGKTSLVYALGKNLYADRIGGEALVPENHEWETISSDLESHWQRGMPTGSQKNYYFYQARNPRRKKHLCLIDIAGESFEDVRNWTTEIYDFFGAYLGSLDGVVVLLDVDENLGSEETERGKAVSRQLVRVVNFLSVAAAVDRIRNTEDLTAKKAAVLSHLDGAGPRFNKPVALCISKADRISQLRFPHLQIKVDPLSSQPLADPWNFVKRAWPAHFEALTHLAPMLKIEWLSCLGPGFEQKRSFDRSLGLQAVMEHVYSEPPPSWALSSREYRRFASLFEGGRFSWLTGWKGVFQRWGS